MNVDCENCGIGYMVDKKRDRQETYLKVRGKINEYFSECNYCKHKTQSGWQITVNRDNHLYFHRIVEKGCSE